MRRVIAHSLTQEGFASFGHVVELLFEFAVDRENVHVMGLQGLQPFPRGRIRVQIEAPQKGFKLT